MAKRRITLLVEPLSILLRASHPDLKTPAIQVIASRGDALRGASGDGSREDIDAFRCGLFGFDGGDLHPPVAALHLMGAEPGAIASDRYYLRCDPVTLSVDRVSVRMTGHGFADLDVAEQTGISRTIESALAAGGINGLTKVASGWILALPEAVPFAFPPLSGTLGSDCSELLPDTPGALPWKRMLNEVQMALHECEVNQRRREKGMREVNSVWFWGGGSAPAPSELCRVGIVFSDHPLTRGLGVWNGSAVHDLADVNRGEPSNGTSEAIDVLVDWEGSRISAEADLLELEQVAHVMVNAVRREGIEMQLIDATGTGWSFDRRCARRFWRRLSQIDANSQPGNLR